MLQAVGGTALTPTSLSIVANLYPEPRERARAIGLWGISSGLGTGLGPIVGGALTEWLGWRSVFAANAIAGVIALVIVLRVVPRSRSAVARRIDVAGQLLVTGFLATLTYALIEAPRYGFGSTRIVVACALAAVLFVAFIVVELRVDEPLDRSRLLPRSPVRRRDLPVRRDVLHVRRVHLLQRALPPGRARLLGARGRAC